MISKDYSFNRCEDNNKWNLFVKESPQGNIFCDTRLLDALQTDYSLWTIEKNNEIHLGAVIMEENGAPLPAPYPFTTYQGVLFNGRSREMIGHKRIKWSLDLTDLLLKELEQKFEMISF